MNKRGTFASNSILIKLLFTAFILTILGVVLKALSEKFGVVWT